MYSQDQFVSDENNRPDLLWWNVEGDSAQVDFGNAVCARNDAEQT